MANAKQRSHMKDKLFNKVRHRDHKPNDNDCVCPGCVEICDKIADKMYKNMKSEIAFFKVMSQ